MSEGTGMLMATQEVLKFQHEPLQAKKQHSAPVPCTKVENLEDSTSLPTDDSSWEKALKLMEEADARTTEMLQNNNPQKMDSQKDGKTAFTKNRSDASSGADTRTTVMIRNIPNAYSSCSFVELFNNHGFWGSYNFVYLPIDFSTGVNLGYAFVNFVSHGYAQSFKAYFHGFHKWFCQSPKVCEVLWTDPHQGLDEYVELYRNSSVMHKDVSDIYKPRLYVDGNRIPFPPPTKRIRPPRRRPEKCSSNGSTTSTTSTVSSTSNTSTYSTTTSTTCSDGMDQD